MPTTETPQPDGETFGFNLDARPASGPALLLVHGFTASSTEMRPLAEYLHEREPDWPILTVRLSGHGSTIADLERVTNGDRPEDVWLADCVAAFEQIRACGRPVVLCGLSMGAALCLRTAATAPDEVAGLVLLAPVLRLARWQRALVELLWPIIPRFPKSADKLEYYRRHELNSLGAYPVRGIRAVGRNGDAAIIASKALEVPALILAGTRDDLTPESQMRDLRHSLGSEHCSLEWLGQSGHLVTVEPDRAHVMAHCHEFIRGLSLDG